MVPHSCCVIPRSGPHAPGFVCAAGRSAARHAQRRVEPHRGDERDGKIERRRGECAEVFGHALVGVVDVGSRPAPHTARSVGRGTLGGQRGRTELFTMSIHDSKGSRSEERKMRWPRTEPHTIEPRRAGGREGEGGSGRDCALKYVVVSVCLVCVQHPLGHP